MWKLNHYLFGWDYIYWENSADHGVSRVKTLPDGTLYYYLYPRLVHKIIKITEPNQVTWLTCKSEKYFKTI